MGKRKKLCHYCQERPGVTRDHIVPRARGGSNEAWNIVPACVKCNSAKANKWPTCPCLICTYARERYESPLAVMQREARPVGNARDYFDALMKEREREEAIERSKESIRRRAQAEGPVEPLPFMGAGARLDSARQTDDKEKD